MNAKVPNKPPVSAAEQTVESVLLVIVASSLEPTIKRKNWKGSKLNTWMWEVVDPLPMIVN
jgi:hypothetical protein